MNKFYYSLPTHYKLTTKVLQTSTNLYSSTRVWLRNPEFADVWYCCSPPSSPRHVVGTASLPLQQRLPIPTTLGSTLGAALERPGPLLTLNDHSGMRQLHAAAAAASHNLPKTKQKT